MYRIKRNGIVTNIGPDQEWLNRHIEMGTFGKSEQIITDTQVTEEVLDELGNIIQEHIETTTTQVIPAEFEVEYVDESIPTQDQINAEALALLASTDWLVVRFMETGIAIPEEVVDQRRDARSKVVR